MTAPSTWDVLSSPANRRSCSIFSLDRKSAKFDALTFPLKLHIILEDAETKGFHDVIAWNPDGQSMQIYDTEEFTRSIMPNYFNQSQFKSFQRQLNIYGFRRMALGKTKGAYSQPFFIRGKPQLAKRIVRKAPPRKGSSRYDPQSSGQQNRTHGFDYDDASASMSPTAVVFQDRNAEELTFPNGAPLPLLDDAFWSMERGGQDSRDKHVLQQRNSSLPPSAVQRRGTTYDHDDDELYHCVQSKQENMDPSSFEAFQPPHLPATPAAMARSKLEGDQRAALDAQIVFPCKLHRLLHDAEQEGFEKVVSWVKNGNAFRVHDIDAFMTQVSPKYFDHSKYESFRRQLNIYSFHRVSSGVDRGIYSHPLFLRGRLDLCRQIARQSVLPVTGASIPSKTHASIVLNPIPRHEAETRHTPPPPPPPPVFPRSFEQIPKRPRVASSHAAIPFQINPSSSHALGSIAS